MRSRDLSNPVKVDVKPPHNALVVLLRDGFALHRSGRLADADRLYAKVLKIDPTNVDALNLRGTIAADQGRPAEAVALYNKAIARAGGNPDVHFNKANALAALGNVNGALASYRDAIRLRPNFADARLNAVNLLLNADRTADAIAAAREMRDACPQDARSHQAVAVCLVKSLPDKITPEAEPIVEGALSAFKRALELAPNDANIRCAMAELYAKAKDLTNACVCLQEALALKPNWPDKRRAEVLTTLGEHLRQAAVYAESVAAHRQALALSPSDPDIRYNLATALLGTWELDEAEQLFLRLLEDDKNLLRTCVNLGNVYRNSNRIDEAGRVFDRALAREPNAAVLYSNLGTIAADRGWYHIGLMFHEKAVEIEDFASTRFKRGMTALPIGQFAQGWRDYDERFLSPYEKLVGRKAPPTFWRGEDLTDKHLLIWGEQGLGDEILHASIVPDILARAARCTIQCTPRLMPLFARSFPAATIQDREIPHDTSSCDYQTAIGSLGRYLRPDFASFPRHAGYLKADQGRISDLREKYLARAQGRKIVGISWRSRNDSLGPDKNTTLDQLAPILRTPGTMFVNLQYGDCSAELAAARERHGVDIFDDAAVDSLKDMDAFFAQVAAMDLVITTSNTSAHVAGSQNVPVWVLLPYAKGTLWYWFVGREDSPWYPSARLIRAPKFDPGRQWMSALAPSVAADLAAVVHRRAQERR